MVDIELYKIFYEVAVCGNITQASKDLNISQPAVTKHIKNLEEALNTVLFIRTRKGVVLTPIGKKIFLDIKNALTILDNVEKDIKEYNEKEAGTIRLGVSTTFVKNYLVEYINDFHKKYPNVNFEISTDTASENIKSLENGLLDMVICKMPSSLDNDLIFTKILDTSYEFIVNKEYFSKIKQPAALKDLLNYPILLQKKDNSTYTSAKKLFKDNNLDVNSNINIGSSSLLSLFTKIGYGIGYVTKLYVDEEIKNNELFIIKTVPETPKIAFGVITLKNNILPTCCEKFIKQIKNNS